MKRLDGKVALITGGGSGFGLGIAETFAREGAQVALIDINGRPPRRRAAGEIGPRPSPFAADVSKART